MIWVSVSHWNKVPGMGISARCFGGPFRVSDPQPCGHPHINQRTWSSSVYPLSFPDIHKLFFLRVGWAGGGSTLYFPSSLINLLPQSPFPLASRWAPWGQSWGGDCDVREGGTLAATLPIWGRLLPAIQSLWSFQTTALHSRTFPFLHTKNTK